MSYNRTQPLSRFHAFTIALACAALWFAFGARLIPLARSTDFLNLYTGASFALHGDWSTIYTESGQLARERTIIPQKRELTPFVRPPAYAIIMAPLALLPFRLAFWFWLVVQIAVLLACWAWAWRRFGPEAVVWAAFSMPGPIGIAHGQDCALFLAVVVGAFALGEKKRPFSSGFVLGLGMLKFHLFLLWPLVLVVQRRWRMLVGVSVCCIAQALLLVWVIGWAGIPRYTNFILHLDAYYSPERYINLGAILLNLQIPYQPVLAILTVLVIGFVLWASRRDSELWMTFALAGAGSLLIGPHAYGYDGTMLLLPALCAIFLSDLPILKLAGATICTPLPVMANIAGPPFACFAACVLLIFTIGLVLETRKCRASTAENIVSSASAGTG